MTELHPRWPRTSEPITAQNFWDLEWCGEAATDWETATDAVHGLRALGIDPPAGLMAQAETVRAI